MLREEVLLRSMNVQVELRQPSLKISTILVKLMGISNKLEKLIILFNLHHMVLFMFIFNQNLQLLFGDRKIS